MHIQRGLQDVFSACKGLRARKMRGTKQGSILSCVKPSTPATADNEPRPLTSSQETKKVQMWVTCLPWGVQMTMRWDVNRWPSSCLSYTPISCTSRHPNLWWVSLTHCHQHCSASQPASCALDAGEWNHTARTLFLLCTGCVFIIPFLLLLYGSVILCFICYLVWFGRLFWGSGNAQTLFHIN